MRLEECEADLARRAIAGDQSALHALVDRHAPHLLKVAYSLTGHAADAEDLVQETFLAGMQALRRFEGRSSVRTWLVAILARQAAAWRRRQRVRHAVEWSPETESAAVGGAPRAGPELSRTDARLDLAAALQTLTPDHREVLVLREYGGLSYEEIAGTLGLPRGTVESRLHRARLELRDRLKGYAPDQSRDR